MNDGVDKFCLDIIDYRGKRVVFLEVIRLKKAQKRPELRNEEFINGQLAKAIKYPDLVYEDFERPNERLVYYYREYRKGNETRYTKVVINIKYIPYRVVTAYRPDRIKEDCPKSKSKIIYDKSRDG